MKKGKQKASGGKNYLIWLIILALKVLGLAFIVQGFVRQIDSGFLFSGVVHYAAGMLLILAAWRAKMKWVQKA